MKNNFEKRDKISYFIFYLVKFIFFCFVSYAIYVILTSPDPESISGKKPETRNSEKLVLAAPAREASPPLVASNHKDTDYSITVNSAPSADRTVTREASRKVTRTVTRDAYPARKALVSSSSASATSFDSNRLNVDSVALDRAK